MESIGTMLPAGMQAAGTVFSAMGQMRAGDAAMEAGRRKQMGLESQAAQLEVNAGQQVAVAQRAAEDDQRMARLAGSRALALAAASGGGASDPTIMNLMAKLAGEGTYRAMANLYSGKEKARGMTDQARMARYSGDVAMSDAAAAKSASRLSAFSTVLNGATSLYSRFGEQSDPAKGGGFDPMTSYYDYGVQ